MLQIMHVYLWYYVRKSFSLKPDAKGMECRRLRKLWVCKLYELEKLWGNQTFLNNFENLLTDIKE